MAESTPRFKKKMDDQRESGYTLFYAFQTVPCVHVGHRLPKPRFYKLRVVNKNAQGQQRITVEWQNDLGEKRRSGILLFTNAVVVNGSIHIRCKSIDSQREHEFVVFRFGPQYTWHAVESPNPDALCVEFAIHSSTVHWREVFADEIVVHPVDNHPDMYDDLWRRVHVPEERRAFGVVEASYIVTLSARFPVIWKEVFQRGITRFFADHDAQAYAFEPWA